MGLIILIVITIVLAVVIGKLVDKPKESYSSGHLEGMTKEEDFSKKSSGRLFFSKSDEPVKEHVEVPIYKYVGKRNWRCAYCEVENDVDADVCSVCGNEKG